MKKIKLLSILLFSLMAFGFSSCSNSQKAGAEDEVTDESGDGIRIIENEPEDGETNTNHSPGVPHVHYYCADKCEGDKVYDEKGNCPVCDKSLSETSEEIH